VPTIATLSPPRGNVDGGSGRAGRDDPDDHKEIRMKSTKHRRGPPHRVAEHHATNLADGVPASDAPSLAPIVAGAVAKTSLVLRARVLRRLLMPVGPLALTVLAGGAFAKYVEFARWSRISVSLEDAARVTSSQMIELVRYVQQCNPAALQQAMVVLSRDATTMAALGTSVAAIVAQLVANRKAVRGPS
jgi:hypothetical protein